LQAFFNFFSKKLKIKGKRNGKEWCEIVGDYMWMGNVQQITRFEVLVNQYGLIDHAQPLFRMATVNA